APQYQAGSYKEAFADIESAWLNGDIDPIRKHLKNDDIKIAVSLKGKYAYSIASSDWADITRDAFDHLQTVSFQFTLLRFQKNGDITGYATHVYTSATKDGDKQDTMYLAYTLRHRNNLWYIVSVNTSPNPLIKEQAGSPAGASDDTAKPSDKGSSDSGS
ncbi:MAG TPA: nuclear transport factor 2 family protein, partial [Capsulimonadaceae bacterium]|nr:nuclear transport factor 2 family protein [Capsulimonadaceae bacterium]